MQLYILHFSEGAEKLQVYNDQKQRDDHYDWYATAHGEEYQATIHRYDASNMDGYHAVCEDIGEDPDWSLWYIDGDIVDYEDLPQGEV